MKKKENTINEIESDAINKKKNILLRICIWLSIIQVYYLLLVQ